MPILSPVQSPELVFGLVAPIGVDLDLVSEVLTQTLREMRYETTVFRLTALMREVNVGLPLLSTTYVGFYRQRIAYANAIRAELGNEAMASLAISAIRAYRSEERVRATLAPSDHITAQSSADENAEAETPLPHRAYVIRQLKRPEEVSLLRSVYGRQFILVSAYAPEKWRKSRIEQQEHRSRGGLVSSAEAAQLADDLLQQDSKETQEPNGQSVRDAFPLGDVFIDATSRSQCETGLRRFVHLLFGSNEISPTHDEYGMYTAKSASLRSSDLSRQVGAAVFLPSGEVAALGCNEVPKAGGGTYWTGDPFDRRDFVEGYDPNERKKVEVLVDIVDRLKRGGHLSQTLLDFEDPIKITKELLRDRTVKSVSESRIMDLIEFGRIIHAEMSAICDAARKGIRIAGGKLYCTTFPCHICAKHIVACGIDEVIYIEPYPKSYASDLHSDAILLDADSSDHHVKFRAFIGVSPFRYRDLFEKGKRKDSSGAAQRWHKGEAAPMIEVFYPQYFKAESHIVSDLGDKMANSGFRTETDKLPLG